MDTNGDNNNFTRNCKIQDSNSRPWALIPCQASYSSQHNQKIELIFFAKTQKALHFDALIEKKVYVQAQDRANTTAYNLTQRNWSRGAAGEHLEPPPQPTSAPSFNSLKQDSNRRLSVVEDGCVAMLPNPPLHEQNHRRGTLAQRAGGGSYSLHPLVCKVIFNSGG
jgi:hypothetical protein